MQVMYWDGKTRKGPMDFPTSAVTRLDTGETVSRLYSDDLKTMAACGYYPAEYATASAGSVITAATWRDRTDPDGIWRQDKTEISQANYDVQQQAAADAEHAADAPDSDLAGWSKHEKLLALAIIELATKHGYTEAQAKDWLRKKWDGLK